jgi:aerobic-type carbon monoxide dehydrogenase small subunit (CoxS/CutS family)
MSEAQEAAPAAAASPPGLEELGRAAHPVTLKVNGASKTLQVEPRATLLDTLRMQLGLTGAKPVCDRGSCGACTVLLNGTAVYSCLQLAIECDGDDITTVEGIAADPKFAGLVNSYCDHDAAQCGYCSPGFVVRSAEVVAKGGYAATPEGVREALAGNTCRCGAYSMIFEAVAKATKGGAA